MNRQSWGEVIARIGRGRPLDIDGSVFGGPAPQERRSDEGVAAEAGPLVTPSTRLLHTRAPGSAGIGVRISHDLPDPERLALQLAAMAHEKRVDPIILAVCAAPDFERWGFRVERLPADPDQRAQAEAELRALWGMAIVIDADDVTLLR